MKLNVHLNLALLLYSGKLKEYSEVKQLESQVHVDLFNSYIFDYIVLIEDLFDDNFVQIVRSFRFLGQI